MDVSYYSTRLAAQAEVIERLARGVPAAQARWKPAPTEWSILEVVCHLYDEEREDFRTRVRLTLQDPSLDWPPIDPQGWPEARRYNERDLAEQLSAFLSERQASLEWVRSLADANWDAAHRHPSGFKIRAGDLLAAWAAHDLLHVRQLADLHRLYLAQVAAPYSTRYAGE